MDSLKIEDTILSEILEKQFDGIKEIFNIDGESFKPFRTDIKEFNINRFDTDFVYEVDNKHLIHFEFQTTNKKEDIYRFMLYDAHLMNTHKMPVYTYVLYSNNISNVINNINYGSINYFFNPIYMNNFSADKVILDIKEKLVNGENLTMKDIVYLELTPLMSSKTDKNEVVNTAMELSTDINDETIRNDCLTVLFGLALKSEMKINDDLWRRISMSELGMKIFNKGKEEGIKEGIKEGILLEKNNTIKILLDLLDDEAISNKVSIPIEVVRKIRIESKSNKI